MRNLEEREKALNMRFVEGKSYGCIAKELELTKDTVKSWCRRYKEKMGIPKAETIQLRTEPIRKEDIHGRTPKSDTAEDRIARLEMEVDLLRNFLILTGRR